MKGIIFNIVKSNGILSLLGVMQLISEKIDSSYNYVFDDLGVDVNDTSVVVNVFIKGQDWNELELDKLFKELECLTKICPDLKFIDTRNLTSGIELKDFYDEFYTDSLKEMLNHKNSIIKKIVMTSVSYPEQYDCFDEFDNKVAYFRLRRGYFTVDCPDCISGTTVYSSSINVEFGNFTSDHERVSELENAIDAVDDFYNGNFYIQREIGFCAVDPYFTYKFKDGIIDVEALKSLYYYERSILSPEEVIKIRKKGPVLGYRDAILKILRKHRMERNNMFPEANGSDGINKEHVEHELEFFKTTVDGLGGDLRTINWLFNKSFEDFEKIFKDYAKVGSNGL